MVLERHSCHSAASRQSQLYLHSPHSAALSMDVGDTVSCQYGTCFCVVNHGFALPWCSYRDGGTEKPSQWLVPSFPSSMSTKFACIPVTRKVRMVTVCRSQVYSSFSFLSHKSERTVQSALKTDRTSAIMALHDVAGALRFHGSNLSLDNP